MLQLQVAGKHPVEIECSTCTEETQVQLSVSYVFSH